MHSHRQLRGSSDCLWKILPGVSCCINTVPRDLSRRKRKSRRPLLIRHCRLLTAATVWPSSLKRNLLSAASADLSSSLDVLNLHSTWITVPSYPVMACDCS